jgi:glycosyltransferase involved in cell wall biosynthesis
METPIMQPRIALALIVKGSDDEAGHLKRCLTNVAPHVDGVFLNINTKPGHKPSPKLMRVAKSFDATITTTEWHDDFAEARNANLAQVPAFFTHILWLDTDDTIDRPEKIRQVAEEAKNVDAIFVDYLYDQDEEGNPLTVHMVARIFKNNGSQVWKGRIHETLIDTRQSSRVGTKDITVIHHSEEDRKNRSLERNIKLLKKQLDDESDNPDPRTLYYLGCSYMDAGQNENAVILLENYLDMSGWDEERCAAHTKLGRIYLEQGNRPKAKEHFMLAMGEDPKDPEPRVEMGSLELELKQFHKARVWLEEVEKMEVSHSTLERNPMSYTFRTYLLLADVYLGLGGSYLDKALEYARKAATYKKKNKHVKEYVKIIEQVVEDKELTKNVLALVRKLKKNKEEDKIKTLVSSVPKQLEDNPLIIKLRDDKPFTWPDKSIAIFCGDSADEEWGPWSLAKGIGGSEEAVIRLSRQLAKLGYKVVVFGKPMDNAGMHDGVMWRNFWEANLDDQFDIFIGWRNPGLFDRKISARKVYLWLHDVVDGGEFTPERLANITKVIVLSEYHRSLFPMIPEEKILMSANGIDTEEFAVWDDNVERDPHKVFYGSSHVRGLAYLYDMWPDIKKAVPDATLDVYYGRGTYDAINAGNPERLKWMDDIQQRAKELDGVTDHGKVSQTDIVRHAFESGVWAYPTFFPEISCITAMKCQASGTVPVVSDFAALKETVQYGEKIDLGTLPDADYEHYKQRLIWWLQHPDAQDAVRRDMMAWARRNFSWAGVAESWSNDFQS